MNICLMTLFGKDLLSRKITIGIIFLILLEFVILYFTYRYLGFWSALICFILWEGFEARNFYVYRKRYEHSLNKLIHHLNDKNDMH